MTACVPAIVEGQRSQLSASIVVPTRNRSKLLPTLIEAILSQRGVDLRELIIVDDASTDATPTVLAEYASNHRVRCYRLGQHRGPSTARNAGWRATRSDIVAFTDDDCIPEPGWLAALIAAHAGGADVVQGETQADIADYGARGTFSHWVEIKGFTHLYETCNVSYRRCLLAALDGFDEAFGTSRGGAPNGEDADLGWRAAKTGAQVSFASKAVVRHPVTQSSFRTALRARLRSFRMVYFIRRHPEYRRYLHRRLFFQKSHPAALLALMSWLPFAVWHQPPLLLVGLAGALPYGHLRARSLRLPGRRRYLPGIIAAAWLIDICDVAVLSAGTLRWRRVLL